MEDLCIESALTSIQEGWKKTYTSKFIAAQVRAYVAYYYRNYTGKWATNLLLHSLCPHSSLGLAWESLLAWS